MFKRRSSTGVAAAAPGSMAPPTRKVQGRPSLGVNVVGRAVAGGMDIMAGGFDMVAGGIDKVAGTTTNVVKRATKVVITDPLSRVARTTVRAGSNVTGAVSATLDLRKKIFPHIGRNRGPRSSIDAQNYLMEASERWTVKEETVQEYITKELKKIFLFAELEPSQLQTLVQAFERIDHAQGDSIIKQGEEGDYFYILYKGTVVFEIDGEVIGSSTADAEDPTSVGGDVEAPKSFGELALYFSAPRAASVLAETDCVLYRLDQVNFRIVAQHQGKIEDKQRVALLKTLPVLKDLDEPSLNKLVSAMTLFEYKKDEVLFRKGDKMTDFFIVQKGAVQATDVVMGGSSYEDLLIGPGQSQQYLGWQAMTQDEPLIANVVAVCDTTVLAIQGETFRRVVGRHDELLQRMHYCRQLQAIAVFRDSQLEEQQILALLDMMQPESFNRKTTLIKEGATIDACMNFVRKGSVVLESKAEGYTKTLDEGAYFGQEWMLVDQNQEVNEELPPLVTSKFTVTANPHTKLDVLMLEDVRKVVDTSLLGLGKPAQISGLDKTINIADVQRHKMLGAGSFGQVWLASYTPPPRKDGTKRKPRIYALKVQSKHQLIETGQAEGVVAEVNIMMSLKSPFIIRLYSTFQDPQRVYMLTSLLQGGELEAVMGDAAMDDSVSKFYAGGILEGLTYMHRRHIIHRDLKPENVLIDSKGYPVIIDLGFAKYVPDKTYTFCGTPMYIAPEVIQYKGHDKGADYWSWACLVFEMVSAKYPFYESGMAELALFKKIIRGQFKVYGFMSFEAKLLFISLFVPDPVMRLGARPNGWQDLYKMPFFNGLDFKALRQQKLKAPWVPELKNPLDSSKFNEVQEVEDKMSVTDPAISSEQQQIFHVFGKTI